MSSPTLEKINDQLYLVRHSDCKYVKVMPFPYANSVMLQQNEYGKQYLICIRKHRNGYYSYYYYEGYSIKDAFYKQECIFSGKFWQSSKMPLNVEKWLYNMALKLALEEDLSYPVNCLAKYGSNSPYKLYVKDSERVVN